MLRDPFTWNFKHPVAFVSANNIRCVLEDYLCFFAGKDRASRGWASEEACIWCFLIVQLLPLVFVGNSRGVDNVESLCVFDFCAKRLELDYVILGLEIWLFFAIFAWWKLEVADRSFSLTIQLNDELFSLRIQILNRYDQKPCICLVHFSWREFESKWFIAAWRNHATVVS